MKNYNCKNCGAEVSHVFNHRCEYCGGILDFNEPEDKVVLIKAEELVDIQFIEENYIPITNEIQLIFSGYKLPKPKIYETDGNIFYSRVEEYKNPTKSYFGIAVKREDLREYGFMIIADQLYHLNVRENEMEKIQWQLIEKGIIPGISL